MIQSGTLKLVANLTNGWALIYNTAEGGNKEKITFKYTSGEDGGSALSESKFAVGPGITLRWFIQNI